MMLCWHPTKRNFINRPISSLHLKSCLWKIFWLSIRQTQLDGITNTASLSCQVINNGLPTNTSDMMECGTREWRKYISLLSFARWMTTEQLSEKEFLNATITVINVCGENGKRFETSLAQLRWRGQSPPSIYHHYKKMTSWRIFPR